MAARIRPTDAEPMTRLKQVSLFTPMRLRILDELAASPGSTASDLGRRIGLHQSAVWGHVRHLVYARMVSQVRDGKRVRLFLVGQATREDRDRALAAEAWSVLELVREGETEAAQIALRLGLSRHAVRGRLAKLQRVGLAQAVETRILVTRLTWKPAE